jgi:hypothetical protein
MWTSTYSNYQARNKNRVHFKTAQDRENFATDLLEIITGEYTLSTGETVQGNAFSYVIQHLRNYSRSGRRWRLPGRFYDHVEAIEEAGFKVLRGRGRRIYHGGKYGLGVECDVVTI